MAGPRCAGIRRIAGPRPTYVGRVPQRTGARRCGPGSGVWLSACGRGEQPSSLHLLCSLRLVRRLCPARRRPAASTSISRDTAKPTGTFSIACRGGPIGRSTRPAGNRPALWPNRSEAFTLMQFTRARSRAVAIDVDAIGLAHLPAGGKLAEILDLGQTRIPNISAA